MDQVYLKKFIKKDVLIERHPNAVFGWVIIIGTVFWVSIWNFGCASLNVYFHVPGWICGILFVSFFAYLMYWLFSTNENCNLTKSSAFVIRDGQMYYIRLGFMPGSGKKNQAMTQAVQRMREDPEVYSDMVTAVLEAKKKHWPNSLHTFCPMNDARIEKVNKKYMWISFVPDKKWISMAKDHSKDYKKIDEETGGIKRAVMRIRRVYDIPLIIDYEKNIVEDF